MASKFNVSQFYCTQCGKRGLDVHRPKGKQREAGHLKKLFCLYCGCEQNHAEIRPYIGDYQYEDFLLEFENGNFTPDGQRITPWRQLRGQILQKKECDT